MAKKVYVMTVQIALEAGSEAEAIDWMQGLMNECVMDNKRFDWGFVKVGKQYLYPTEQYVGSDWSIEDL